MLPLVALLASLLVHPACGEEVPRDPGSDGLELSATGSLVRPLLQEWPWAVGRASAWVPLRGRLASVGGGELWPSGRGELRAGLGRDGWIRLRGGPLVAFHPLDEALPLQGGAWIQAARRGLRTQVRAATDGATHTLDAWVQWRESYSLGEVFSLWPWAWAGRIWGDDPSRHLGPGSAPAAIRWRETLGPVEDHGATARLEVEAWIPTGEVPGPADLRITALRLRVGADTGLFPEAGFVWGWATAAGLHVQPWRRVAGTGWAILATSPDLAERSLLFALSVQVPPAWRPDEG